jgi:hypothetical protein
MLDTSDLADRVAEAKALLRRQLPNARDVFADAAESLEAEAAELAARHADGEPVIPEIAYRDIAAGAVPAASVAAIRARGCVVVRGVYPRAQAEAWDAELMDYVRRNDYVGLAQRKMGLDKYFSRMKSGKPQIYGIYWSRPQVEARQGEPLAITRAWLNRLWTFQDPDGTTWFDPDLECTYADRIRQREPGDGTLGLSPHMDGGSVERWIDPGFRAVYRHVFSGDWRRHDPWAAAHRTRTREIPSPAVCQMFRTYQGWTALTEQGPGDGTLQVVPMARAIVYMLLRPLQPDVEPAELCGAEAGRALWMRERWHPGLLRALLPIPRVQPGDTVWWHPDVVHAVEDAHTGRGYSSVIYIGAAPDCAKNRAYLPRQRAAFAAGESAPDFAPENYEVGFSGRATEADLTALGRRQMGFD